MESPLARPTPRPKISCLVPHGHLRLDASVQRHLLQFERLAILLCEVNLCVGRNYQQPTRHVRARARDDDGPPLRSRSASRGLRSGGPAPDGTRRERSDVAIERGWTAGW